MAYRPPHRRSPAPGPSQAEGIAPPAAPKPNPYAQAWSRGQSPLPPLASPSPPPNSSRPSFRHPAPSAASSTQGNRPAPSDFAGGGSASFPSVRRPATDTFGVGGGGGSRAMDRTGRGGYGGGGGYGGDGRTGPGSSARGGGAGIGRAGMRLAAPRKNTPKPDDMELLASVSRSGGDDADGDALKEYSTQERFRAYIDGRVSCLQRCCLLALTADTAISQRARRARRTGNPGHDSAPVPQTPGGRRRKPPPRRVRH